MNKSESIVKLAEALALAQAEMPAVKFNSTNPFLKNKYADLGAIIETSQPVLAKFGLAVSQLIYSEGEQVGVETMLIHKSGEWISTAISMATMDEKGKSNAQVAGSIVTYLRRYSLAAILNMFADEDGDGNKPVGKHDWEPEKVENKAEIKPEVATETDKPFTLEDACKVISETEQVAYEKLTVSQLAARCTSLLKKVKDNGLTPEVKADAEMRLKAAKMVMEAKKRGEL